MHAHPQRPTPHLAISSPRCAAGRQRIKPTRCACPFGCSRPTEPDNAPWCEECQQCRATWGNHGCRCRSADCDGFYCDGAAQRLRSGLVTNSTVVLAARIDLDKAGRPPADSHPRAEPEVARLHRGRSKRTKDDIHETSRALGLSQPLERDLGMWTAPPGSEEAAAAARLLGVHRELVRTANKSDNRLGTALEFLKLFKARFPHRILFHSLDGNRSHAAARHNSETKGMLAAFISENGSIAPGKKKGKPILQSTIAGYVSAIATECAVASGYAPTDERRDVGAARSGKSMRRAEGKRGAGDATRKLRRGIRAQHLRQAAAAGIDRFSRSGARRWARDLVAHNLYLRGGEAGVEGDPADFNPAEGHITAASLKWFTAAEAGQEQPAFRLFVMPIKDTNETLKPIPQFVERRNGPEVPVGSDPLCAYDAVLLMWRNDFAAASATQLAATPLFQSDTDGVAVNTEVMREDARMIARLTGMTEMEVGGTSFRIGGAEDTYDLFGVEGEAVIRERGRWHSDIHQLYQRCSAARHMHVSTQIGNSTGASLEALGEGWANPGRR